MDIQLEKNTMDNSSSSMEIIEEFQRDLDDDGREKRTGTLISASAHIITAVIGSGVLSLSWAIAQLGWVTGPTILLVFSCITYFTSTLLADSYRTPDPVFGKRNYTYMDVVRANLGGIQVQLCGIAQYVNLVGVTIGYTITSSISIVAVKKSNCFHNKGRNVDCKSLDYPYVMIFAVIQIVLSQLQNFHKLTWLSMVATVMSITYSVIGLGLSIAKVAGRERKHVKTSLTGVTVGIDVSEAEKVWRSFQAIGDIAFAYAYSTVLIEIQDTLKSTISENKVMKQASLVGVSTTTLFYILCGCIGYATFGNNARGNFLTSFYEPFWLIDLANICIVVHLIGAYQVFAQPLFAFVEMKCKQKWPESKFMTKEHMVNIPFFGGYYINMFRLVWRSAYVVMTAVIAMIFPFFNSFLGLIGAASFYPLTVYFPIEMYIARAKIPQFSFTWLWLKILSCTCLVISLVAAIGSVQGLLNDLRKYQPFTAQ